MELTQAQYQEIVRLVYDKLGVMYDGGKRRFVEKQVRLRARALALDDPDAYIRFLKRNADDPEFQRFINHVTIGETYFFREKRQLDLFQKQLLPDCLKKKTSARDRNLKLWSAGCASGEEAYSLAILLRESISDISAWNLVLKGTDVNLSSLTKARSPAYDERSVKGVDEGLLKKYFNSMQSCYMPKPVLREMVVWEHLNLFDRQRMGKETAYDFIFCRNVLIYFDKPSRRQVLQGFYDALNPGGYLFLGHAEPVNQFCDFFKSRLIDGTYCYYRG